MLEPVCIKPGRITQTPTNNDYRKSRIQIQITDTNSFWQAKEVLYSSTLYFMWLNMHSRQLVSIW